MRIVELVRHEQALKRGTWTDRPDVERPLTEEGRAAARDLAEALLAEGPVDAVYTSPLVRCRQTVEPLATRAGLVPEEVDALAELRALPVTDRGDAWVAAGWLGGRALRCLEAVLDRGGRTVVCSHGDVVSALLATLAGRDGLDLADVHVRKGARVTLHFDQARCVRAEPRPPAAE